tara:strand:+ start:1846 stop:2124 length:279 start_codon:yes stop_codon:yes gene_type:complete
MKDNKKPLLASIDGFQRSQSQEEQLNDLFVNCFRTEHGDKVLKYLRSITIETVAGFNISNEELRSREGMRFLVGIIEQRIKEGENVRARKSN